MVDQSLLNHSSPQEDDKYINECIKEVCLKGDSITKYKRMLEKKYGVEVYEKCKKFIQEVRRAKSRGRFTNTSKTNLEYIAKEIYVSSGTIETIIAQVSMQDPGNHDAGEVTARKPKEVKRGAKEEEQKQEQVKIEAEAQRKRIAAKQRRKAKLKKMEDAAHEQQRKEKEERRALEERMEQEQRAENARELVRWVFLVPAIVVWIAFPPYGFFIGLALIGISWAIRLWIIK